MVFIIFAFQHKNMSQHHHTHNHGMPEGKNLFLSVVLNLGITIAQVIGGIVSGSMALLSDALHNFSDVLSLLITFFTFRLAQKKHTEKRTFGYRRGEILAAFINSVTLLVIASFLVYEAGYRIFHPQKINAQIVVGLALASILINGASVLLIRRGAQKNINIRSAYLHLFTDMLTSVAVLVGGLLVHYFALFWVDGVITLLIALFLIYSGWKILTESVGIIMLFSPEEVNIDALARQIEAIDGIKNLHHLHLWRLTDNQIHMEAHVDVACDMTVSAFEEKLKAIETIAAEMGIHHVTIQPEWTRNDDKKLIHDTR